MEKINIRKVAPGEVNELQKISRQTFLEAFSEGNTEENMRLYLEEAFSIEKLAAELNDANTLFFFAVLENNILGYLKLNSAAAQTEPIGDNALEIERIYVRKEFYGKRIGQLLYEKALQIANQMKADCVWLGVWEENHRAIKFYSKNGFVEFDKHNFTLGNDEQTDIMMKKKLGG